MAFFIKEWSDKTATLMADNGTVLWTFPSVEEAQLVCREWYSLQSEERPDYDGCMDPLVAMCTVS